MKMRLYLILAACVIVLTGVCNTAFAGSNYTDYNVTNEIELNSALTDTSVTAKTLNINSAVTLTGNLSTPSGTTIFIEGNNKTLDGGGKTGFSVVSGQTLNINNYGSYTKASDGTITITTAIQNFANTLNGGVINNAGTLTIGGSVFSSNSSTDANFYGGGAIYNSSGTLNIIDSVFYANEASLVGGAIRNEGTASIIGTKFINNSVSLSTSNGAEGGAIFNMGKLNIAGSIFTGNYTTNSVGSSYGGAISTSGSSTTIYGSTFEGNGIQNYSTIDHSGTTITENGGAIFNNCTNTIIDNSHFNYNAASYIGGAIYNRSAMSIFNSQFTSNTAVNGGAIYNNVTASVINSTFTNNKATTAGGAIYSTLDSKTNIYNSTFEGNTAAVQGGAIYSDAGLVNLIASGGDVIFAGNKANGFDNDIYLKTEYSDSAHGHTPIISTLNLNAKEGNNIIFNGGIISTTRNNIININKAYASGDSTTTVVDAPTTGQIVFNASVDTAKINLYGGTLTLIRDNYLDGNALTLAGGTLNMQNNATGAMTLNSLALTGATNLKIDVDLANAKSDTINSSSASTVSGILNISSIKLLSNSVNTSTTTSLTNDAALAKNITLGVTKAYTPIYQYGITYDGNGNLVFAGGGSGSGGGGGGFNPAILNAPVSANVGAYMSQVATYNEALGRAELFMSLPQGERTLMKQRNMYANVGGNDVQPEVFSPTFLPDEKGGIWFKQYTSFENVPMNNGPNVSNVGYGVMVGADSPMYHLKNGFDGYLTTYVSYNGSHQNYDSVGVNQNGGALGITGTLYKGNFFTALTASVGDSYGQANTMYGVDNFNTLLAGLAWKSGYNIEMAQGKFILQPSLLAAYTFANTFDYTTASGVNMSSDPMNAVQIAPGVKFIYNAKDGWQPYLAANMVFNIMDTQKFYANTANLPQMSIDPYFEYGVGVQRRWGERFTGFGQAMLRGGGRNGIALQFGFRLAIGK